MVSRPSGRVARVRPQGVSRGTGPNYVTRTQRVWLAFAMRVYGVAVVDRHRNVGHCFTAEAINVIAIVVVSAFIFSFLLMGTPTRNGSATSEQLNASCSDT
jgi:hypothetical protein